MDKIALFFSGQGSQFVGMGKSFYDNYLICRKTYEEASDVSGVDIAKLCFEDSIVNLSKFDKMQLAVVTTNVAIARSYFYEYGMQPQFCVGHSIGEICALVSVGAVTFADAIKILMKRSELIKDIMKTKPGYMIVVEGTNGDTIKKLIKEKEFENDVFVACESSNSQVLVSGRGDSFEDIQSILLDMNTRITPMIVSPPMHSPLLQPIEQEFYEYLKGIEFYPFRNPIISNYTGKPFSSVKDIPTILSKHLSNPVKWRESVNCLEKYGVSLAIEMGPKNIVANFIANLNPNVTTYCYGQKMDRKILHENFTSDPFYEKDIPDFFGRCLGIAVSCQNHNDNSDEYNMGVVMSYNNIKKLYTHQQETKGKLNAVDMQTAVDNLKMIFKAKKLPEDEQNMWLKQLYDETSTYYQFNI